MALKSLLPQKPSNTIDGHVAGYGIVDLLIKSHFAETSEPRDRLLAHVAATPDVKKVESDDIAAITLQPDYKSFR